MKEELDIRHRAPLGYLIHEVARLMKRRFEDEARSLGITLPQWRALAQIAKNDCSTQRSIAAQIDADPMTVSGILDRLEKRGLIVRMPDPTDSRAKIAQLTDEGRQLFDGGRAFAGAMYEQTLQGVTPEQRDAVILALNTMRDNLSGSTAEVEEA